MITPDEAIKAFIYHARYERALSANTCEHYGRDIRAFFSSIDTLELSRIHAADIQHWLSAQHALKKSAKTLARFLASLRGFFDYCLRQHWCDTNPALGIKAPKQAKTLPKTLDVDQLQALLQSKSQAPLMIRDLAIMELFYSSGLRLSELVACDINDIDYTSGMIRVIGKGNKTRIVPVGATALKQIELWLKTRVIFAIDDNPALFIGQRGQRLTPRAIQKRLHEWGVKAGLDAALHPHQLRHSVASHLLESSGDLRAVQEFLGHSNLATTQIYTSLDFQHLSHIYDATHPRAKK